MKRRNFLKMLGIVVANPLEAIKFVAKIPVKELPKVGMAAWNNTASSAPLSPAMLDDLFHKILKTHYLPAIQVQLMDNRKIFGSLFEKCEPNSIGPALTARPMQRSRRSHQEASRTRLP